MVDFRHMYGNSLTIGIVCFLVGALAELLLFINKVCWNKRRWLASVSLVMTAFATGYFSFQYPSVVTILIAFLSIYRVINNVREVDGRMVEAYLKRSSRRTFKWLGAAQIIIILVWYIFRHYSFQVSTDSIYAGFGLIILISSLLILINTIVNVIKTKSPSRQIIADKDLPDVTLAISARNEDRNLEDCLNMAIASDYPKLEIIVLDDCSQDRTAEIIRNFAHDGVRFIQSEDNKDNWLDKNKAYQTLLEQASGQLILFSGVDARFQTKTIRHLVEVYSLKNVTMMSVLPRRVGSGIIAAFIQPMRYWWEMAVPKYLLNRPPTLSTCWLVNREALIKMGGFKSITRQIVPEEHLAKLLNMDGKYAFIRNDSDLEVSTQKSFHSQWLTAVRTRYPQAHRRPEKVALRSLIMIIFWIAPFIALPLTIFSLNVPNLYIAALSISIAALIAANVFICIVTNPDMTLISLINFPIEVVIDLIALNISMYRYEFDEVVWKGRNISGTVMHVEPSLPAID